MRRRTTGDDDSVASRLRRFAEDLQLLGGVLLVLPLIGVARDTGLYRAALRLRTDEALVRLIAHRARALRRPKGFAEYREDIRDATAILRARGLSPAAIERRVRALDASARHRRPARSRPSRP